MKNYLKKSIALLMVLFLLFNSSSTFAESYFTNSSELDNAFKQLEKAFMAADQSEIPSECEISAEGVLVSKKLPKMSSAAIKAAVTEKLNDIKVAIEIIEEELGGLSKQEYKMISDQLIAKITTSGNGTLYWDKDAKYVTLSLGLNEDDYEEFEGLVGNFERMGKEKDQVSQADLQVKGKIKRYLNQSIQKGNKVDPEILKKLPEEVENLFNELQPSKYIAFRTLAEIHRSIYDSDIRKFDGSEPIESMLECYQYWIESGQEERAQKIKVEDYEFPVDSPSVKVRDSIVERILKGELSESFTSGFNKAITLDELAKLYYGSIEYDDKIELENGTIDESAPDYIKYAFIYGMIDDQKDLEKPITRLEAARRLVKSTAYDGLWDELEFNDYLKIPVQDLVTVASCIGKMRTRGINFEPQSMYTKEEAIIDKLGFDELNIRGYNMPSLDEPSKVVIGKNTVHLQFEDNEQIEEYIKDHFDSKILRIKRNGSYLRIDTGCALLEFFTPEKGIKFTFKNGVKYVDFEEGCYGPELQYEIEPQLLKANEKVNMNMQPDKIHKKLYAKLDTILAKIIKPKMSEEQKVKAIHDYIVSFLTYDLRYIGDQDVDDLYKTLSVGRGVCGDYAPMFKFFCERASIPCIEEIGISSASASVLHAWNAVYLNDQWKFVDTTWDDGPNGKILYTYYLKDKYSFMKTHTPKMGVVDKGLYTDIDNMNIKSQDELRAYVLDKFYWIDGFKLTFRMSDKKIKPFVGYIWTDAEIKIDLKYDSKNNLYTLSAKKR